jgi:energy-coupling factor transporter ATP-binding protein EcfA2
MVEVDRLGVSYGNKAVLNDISCTVKAGEFVLISGPSGCGKSTLALTLTGLIPHAKKAQMNGAVRIGGIDTRERSVAELASHIGIVFQNTWSQLFHSTVEEEVSFAPRNRRLSPVEIVQRTDFALSSAGITHLRGNRLVELSEGERHRVAIASILSMKPKILVLDEPTANLDWRGVELVMETISKLNRELGITVLVIEHRLSAVYHYCSKALIMKEGGIVCFGNRESVLSDKSRLVRLGLRFPWRWVERGPERYVPDGITPPDREEEPIVTLEKVKARYGKREILHGIDLTIYPGEFLALVGNNGAGKSTLARVIAGLHRPKSGRVRWHPALKKLPMGRRVGFMFQATGEQLLCSSVMEEVSLGPECFGLERQVCTERAIELMDLSALEHRPTHTLSMGEGQRCVLASVFAVNPVLFILDEPTVGQDWAHLSRVMSYLKRLRKMGKAILLITHDDKLVCRFAERIVLLEEGRIIADGIPIKSAGEKSVRAAF